jgi:hypothetical protein
MRAEFWLESLKVRHHSKDLGVDGRIMIKWMLGKIGWEDANWIHLVKGGAQWRALVNTALNLQVP